MADYYPAIQRAKEISNSKLAAIRDRIQGVVVPEGEIIVTCGSYARREACNESDIDFFAITREEEPPSILPTWFKKVDKAINEIVPVQPSEDGAFKNIEVKDKMLLNIGGQQDDNAKITRRMLFLLEGEWLLNPTGVRELRREILERYVADGIHDLQITLFLLNDIIRYYRTMAVDYEHKSFEIKKPWGIRNIKLVFSRKLLYASGLFSVACTYELCRKSKIDRLEHLFELPVIDRMNEICGSSAMKAVLSGYDHFLDRIEKKDVRDELKSLKREERNSSELFRELKDQGYDFTRHLMALFQATFDSTNPIHQAVIF